MKKLFHLFALSMLLFACSEDDQITTDNVLLSERLPGSTWNLRTVSYFAVIPNPDNPNQMLPINGNGTEVMGQFTFLVDPPEAIDYDISFVAGATLPDGQAVVVPIKWENKGIWSLEENETKVQVIAENDTLLFSIIKNTEIEQVWSTIVPQFIGEINDFVDVDIEFSMTK